MIAVVLGLLGLALVAAAALVLPLLPLVLPRRDPSDLPRPLPDTVPEEDTDKPFVYPNLPHKVMVAGGAGFIGQRIVKRLLDMGCEVTVLDDQQPTDARVRFVRGDARQASHCRRAADGAQGIIHAALPPRTLPFEAQRALLVDGTANVVAAAAASSVPLVLISDASAPHGGDAAAHRLAPSPPPAPTAPSPAATRADLHLTAEAAVASSPSGLPFCVVRTRGLYGPGDDASGDGCVGWAAQRAHAGADGGVGVVGRDPEVHVTFVDNAAHGALLALAGLAAGKAGVAGSAFNVTDEAPVRLWAFVRGVLEGFGYAPSSAAVPLLPLRVLGAPLGWPQWRVGAASLDRTFDGTSARDVLQYRPLYTPAEAVRATVAAAPRLRCPQALKQHGMDKPTGPFTRRQVANHCTEGDAWIIIERKVYDISEFVDEHPGGVDTIMARAGQDATEGFKGPQHPDTVYGVIPRLYIGDLADGE